MYLNNGNNSTLRDPDSEAQYATYLMCTATLHDWLKKAYLDADHRINYNVGVNVDPTKISTIMH